MHKIYLFLTIITSFLLLLTGTGVVIRNYTSKIHRSFFFFCFWTALWILVNFLSNDLTLHTDILSITNHMVLAFGSFALASLTVFTYYLSFRIYKKFFFIILFLCILSGIASFTPLIVQDIKPTSQAVEIIFGPFATVYFFSLITAILYSTFALITQFIRSRGEERKKIKIIIISIVLTCTVSMMTNIIAPIFGYFDLTNIGTFSTLILVLGTAYAVIFNQMFEFHTFFWRFIIYLVTVGIFTAIVAGLILVGLFTFLGNTAVKPIEIIYILIVFIPLMILFHPINERIKMFTNKYLFQRDYVIQEALSEISSFASKSIDIKMIQRNVLDTLSKTIKQQYGLFIFISNKSIKIGEQKGTIPLNLIQVIPEIIKLSVKTKQKVITLTDIQEEGLLNKYFDLFSIGAIVILTNRVKVQGLIILGEKFSGSLYVKKDKEFLTITSHDIALALSNAQRYEEIKQFNITLQEKISNATAALKRTNKKLIALDDVKDEFISMTSHQLRTPLTSVKGYISMLLEEDLGKLNSKQKMALKEAFDSSQRMVFLISDFLNVSRIRTGKFIIEPTEMNMSEVIQDEIQQLKEMAGFRNQNVIFKTPKDFPKVMLDENKVRQVMMNMIDNAIFYTPQGGDITIALLHENNEVTFAVKDSGIGVPKDQQHRLFTKFFRAENARRARPDGTGLGLFMAQKIISAQGGSIIFKSVENEGSTFGFRFPDSIIIKKT